MGRLYIITKKNENGTDLFCGPDWSKPTGSTWHPNKLDASVFGPTEQHVRDAMKDDSSVDFTGAKIIPYS